MKALAAFKPPRAIVADFSALFPDTKCDENDVKRLDPKLALVAPELAALFLSERERIKADPMSVPFSEQWARIKVLNEQVEFYISNNQLAEARVVLRQIAEEQGVVGGKGPKVAAASDAKPGESVVEIVRRVIDAKVDEPEPTE